MKAILALWRREFAEHRGAYLWAPLIAFAVFIVTAASILIRARFELPAEAMMLPVRRLYEDAVLIGFLLWWIYFGAACAFYLADAFHADRRNNAILFWKSMPVSDFAMLMSKLTFGVLASVSLTIVYTAATGAVLAVLAMFIGVVVPVLVPPTLDEVFSSLGTLSVFAAGFAALSAVWYLPFLAWVAALSTLVRRWAIPLAVLIPGAASLIEVSVLRTNVIGSYFGWRVRFGFGDEAGGLMTLSSLFYTLVPLNGNDLLALVMLGIDWWQFAGGAIVAVILVYIASEYRRRRIET